MVFESCWEYDPEERPTLGEVEKAFESSESIPPDTSPLEPDNKISRELRNVKYDVEIDFRPVRGVF
jgi:hypothetical protein